jgi:hypothetical protein
MTKTIRKTARFAFYWQVGRVAISFVASVSYPCIHFASREMLHNLLGGRCGTTQQLPRVHIETQ